MDPCSRKTASPWVTKSICMGLSNLARVQYLGRTSFLSPLKSSTILRVSGQSFWERCSRVCSNFVWELLDKSRTKGLFRSFFLILSRLAQLWELMPRILPCPSMLKNMREFGSMSFSSGAKLEWVGDDLSSSTRILTAVIKDAVSSFFLGTSKLWSKLPKAIFRSISMMVPVTLLSFGAMALFFKLHPYPEICNGGLFQSFIVLRLDISLFKNALAPDFSVWALTLNSLM